MGPVVNIPGERHLGPAKQDTMASRATLPHNAGDSGGYDER